MQYLDKPLLVASVFSQTPRNKELVNLQYKFLNKTTYNFVHCACLNPGVESSPFTDSILIHNNDDDHLAGISTIIQFFKQNRNDYSHCLLLDSDCFPIKPWQDILLKSMAEYKIHVAAAVRVENLTRTGHPLVVYFTEPVVKFSWDRIGDVMDKVRRDVRLDNKRFYPMLKTNKVNLHFMFGAIYGDMFFHIGAASRDDERHWIEQFYPQNELTADQIYDLVVKDPEDFIDKVRSLAPVRHTEDVT